MGLGLEASRPAKRGDVLLSVPASLALSAEAALRSPDLGELLAPFEPSLGEFSFIACLLMQQRFAGDDSPLAPWLSSPILPPEGYPSLPLLWADEEKAELATSSTVGFAERLEGAAADFEWLEENVFSSSPMQFPPFVFTSQAFTAALALSISRAVPLPVNDDPTDLQGGSEATVELVALEELSAGDPLTRAYGGEVGADLLVDHGFIERRVAACAMVSFAIEEQVLYEEQLATDGPPAEMLAFLRLKHLKGADCFLLESIFADSLWSEHLQLPVSEENEKAALQDVAQSITYQLDRMAGSLQADLQILSEGSETSNAFKMASVRYAERRALEAGARWLDAQLLRLSDLEYYQERRLNALGLNPVETDEELEALKAAGRSYGANEVEW
ncbi:MAG: hypothetical protein SGPRY_008468 [Prymnesium sp.]